MNRVKEKYLNTVKPALIEKFNYTSVMQAPKLDKIVINMGGSVICGRTGLSSGARLMPRKAITS